MMKYNNDTVRRQDRLLDEERAIELLRNNEYGVLSMIDADGHPYGIPVNYVWNGENSIYIHCAPVGKKLLALQKDARVSFCLVGKVHLLPQQFTTEYESVVLTGTAVVGLSDEEKMQALRLLVEKLSPEFKELGDKYSHQSFHRVEIIRIDFAEYSGKRKKVMTKERG